MRRRRLALGGFDQQVDALRTVEPVDREHEALWLGVAIGERLRWMREHRRSDPVEPLQAVGDVLRCGKDTPRFPECDGVEPLDRSTGRAVSG